MTNETPEGYRASDDLNQAIEALIHIQAFVAGRLLHEMADAGLITSDHAQVRLAAMADDIGAMKLPGGGIRGAVAFLMRRYAEEPRPNIPPALTLVSDRDRPLEL